MIKNNPSGGWGHSPIGHDTGMWFFVFWAVLSAGLLFAFLHRVGVL